MDQRRTLITLPILVQSRICSYLDASSLMNLRLTCRRLKEVVEQPCILKNLPIKVTHSKQLQRVLDSKLPLNNFILSFKSLREQTYFAAFVPKFGRLIRKLVIEKGTDDFTKVIFLLKSCVQLEELEIERLSVAALVSSTEDFNTILQNFNGSLQKLVIHDLLPGHESTKGITIIETFLKVLQSCNSLVEFKVPCIQAYNDKLSDLYKMLNNREEDYDNDDDDDDDAEWEWEASGNEPEDPLPEWNPKTDKDVLIHSIIDYVLAKSAKNNCNNIERIDIKSMGHFQLESFQDLLKICFEKNIKIMNLQSTQLFSIREGISAINPEYFSVFQSAKVTHGGFPLSCMDNLSDLHFCMYPFWTLQQVNGRSRDHDMDASVSLLLPNLKFLRVEFMFDEHEHNGINEFIIRKLFREYKRASVKKLHLRWCMPKSFTVVSVSDLAFNFRNLRQLTLDGWEAREEVFNELWTSLLALQDVRLKNCRNLNNRAFVGRYNITDPSNVHLRPLNRLKGLDTLFIQGAVGNVNEDAFMGSFKYLKLRKFVFEVETDIKVDWELYNHLVNAPFGQTIEYFTAPRPVPHRYLNEKNVMRKFNNLKRRCLV